MRWFRVYVDNGKEVLDIFPYEPGGSTLHLPPEEAEALARLLVTASDQLKENTNAYR